MSVRRLVWCLLVSMVVSLGHIGPPDSSAIFAWGQWPSNLRMLPGAPAWPPRSPFPLPAPAPSGTRLREGGVYREESRPEVYAIQSGRKVHIPTEDALFAMGYDWSAVTVVPDATLAPYPVFIIPSLSPTPASLIYPPGIKGWQPLRNIAGATRLVSRGREIQHVELRGWIRGMACGDGEDVNLSFELDTEWAASRGMDLNRLLRVGNVRTGHILPGFSPRRAVALPLIKIEVDSAGRAHGDGKAFPRDWQSYNECGRVYPFNVYEPTLNAPPLQMEGFELHKRLAYVRVAGSLITDSPHDNEAVLWSWLSGSLAITRNADDEWRGSAADWSPGRDAYTDPEHYARWTEIHPPDLIEILPMREPGVTVRVVALNARPGIVANTACEDVDFRLEPEQPRPSSDWVVAFQELIGPETFLPSAAEGINGTWPIVYDDHVRLRARACGGGMFGSAGRLKAIYRVWWTERPDTPQPRSGSFSTQVDRNRVDWRVDPGVLPADSVEVRLCQAERLTWEKSLILPRSGGPAATLQVRDGRKCDSVALPAWSVGVGLLRFSKAKAFGIMTEVHRVGAAEFGPLPPGSRLTFNWMND